MQFGERAQAQGPAARPADRGRRYTIRLCGAWGPECPRALGFPGREPRAEETQSQTGAFFVHDPLCVVEGRFPQP